MRKGRFTEEQMVAIIREADREPVSAVSKRHGVSEQAIYTWHKRFGGFEANDVRRLRQLEAENARLKKLVAERDLEIEVLPPVTPDEPPKGIAEVVMIPVVPAILNAVFDATGRRFQSLPVTQAMLKGALT